jgi:hypothetical protein
MGVVLKPSDRQQTVRCVWHDDRTPSLSVNPARCVWHCHACHVGGGLQTLRELADVTPDDGPRVSHTAALARLAEWCTPGADPLALVPVEAIEELQARTGRHKRPRTLSDNLARLLASAHEQMRSVGFTSGVAYSQLDASRDGIPARIWQHLVALKLDALGGRSIVGIWFDVTVGESGRHCPRSRFRGTGKGGAFRATELALRDRHYSLHGGRDSELSADRSPVRDNAISSFTLPWSTPEATVVASQAASRPRADVPTLHRRPAVALLLSALLDASQSVLDTDVVDLANDLVMDDLVAMFGSRVRRSVRSAESFGWVRVSICPVRGAWCVVLTDAGRMRLADDVEAGTEYRNQRATQWQKWWGKRQVALRADADERAREIARRAAARGAEWVPHPGGHVRHAVTGEVRTLESLRG